MPNRRHNRLDADNIQCTCQIVGEHMQRHLEEIGLLARVAAGEAFRGLVDRHLPTVLAIARRKLRDDAEAEDVAQETKQRLWSNAAELELGPNAPLAPAGSL